jgi:hypothetical protein
MEYIFGTFNDDQLIIFAIFLILIYIIYNNEVQDEQIKKSTNKSKN